MMSLPARRSATRACLLLLTAAACQRECAPGRAAVAGDQASPRAESPTRAPRPAPRDTGQHDPCPNADSQSALTRCADTVARRADAALNAVYRQAVARTGPDRRPLLREAQRRWMAFRDAHCLHEASLYAGGSMYPMQQLFCRASLSEARTEQLRREMEYEASL